MFVCYMWCKAYNHVALGEYGLELEAEPAGYVIAYDPTEPTDLDLAYPDANESLWLVPVVNPWQ